MVEVHKNSEKVRSTNIHFNKWAYGLLSASGILIFLISNDKMMGLTNLALALAFDPFDQTVKWNSRPRFQKIWLIVHITALLLLMVLMIIK